MRFLRNPDPAQQAARMRLRGMIRKEARQIVRDPSSIAIAFVLPILLLLLFGYGISLDAKHVPLGIVIESSSPEAAAFAGSFEQSEYLSPHRFGTIQEAEQALITHEVDGIVWLRNDFEEKLLSGANAPIGVIINGVDANTAHIIEGYVKGAWLSWLQQRAAEQAGELNLPVQLQQRVWFNAELRSQNFLVPGLIAVIMTLIGALLTAMVIAREWERGTMEALLVTPVTAKEILLGKLLPYFVLGIGGLALSVGMAVWLFGVPLHGSLPVLFISSSLFLIASLGMGLTISTVARNQFVAGQIAIIVSFLPAFMLSGFIFDINSMPPAVQVVTYLLPARYYVSILQTVFLAGNVWKVIGLNSLALIVFCAFFLGIARRRMSKRLE
ncbi:ABC transporter permease [Pontiella sulfatireligans]|uniref:Inner membrane transport permease YbhS n=1 Tax=Pontiella sulfatireligans TaxID=2750658 RepID=A0A6C2UF70_9BACT|nr:ABC transporter permease [Pontiella sulfatireligans]VGO18569.1 Inner membrane transport permease YbhS [Pontiella sulfatireligans]